MKMLKLGDRAPSPGGLSRKDRLSKMEGDRNIGRAIDKLTREKMMQLNPYRCAKCGRPKPIVCTVDGAPWCEACFDRALGLGSKEGRQ